MAGMTEYPMQCGHKILYDIPPRVGDDLWCLKCDAPTRVLRTAFKVKNELSKTKHAGDYRMYCHHCMKTRYIGRLRDSETDENFQKRADRSAYAHAQKHDHSVDLYQPGGKLSKTVTRGVPGQLSLFETVGDLK